jgi:hypothetical protein
MPCDFNDASFLMLLEAGCWLNGSKLQDIELKKKVFPRHMSVFVMFPSICLLAITQQMRLLGGRAMQ